VGGEVKLVGIKRTRSFQLSQSNNVQDLLNKIRSTKALSDNAGKYLSDSMIKKLLSKSIVK